MNKLKNLYYRVLGKCPRCKVKLGWFAVACWLCHFDRWDLR